MWTRENRGRYDRSKLRYPSDVSDEEWALVAPLIPAAKRGGNKRRVNLREGVNGLMYILSTGCQWGVTPWNGAGFTLSGTERERYAAARRGGSPRNGRKPSGARLLLTPQT